MQYIQIIKIITTFEKWLNYDVILDEMLHLWHSLTQSPLFHRTELRWYRTPVNINVDINTLYSKYFHHFRIVLKFYNLFFKKFGKIYLKFKQYSNSWLTTFVVYTLNLCATLSCYKFEKEKKCEIIFYFNIYFDRKNVIILRCSIHT